MKPDNQHTPCRFIGIENATPDWLHNMIPAGWICNYEPYTVDFGYPTSHGYRRTKQTVRQWKFTSPDGNEELRIHKGDPRYTENRYIARWGIRYTGQKEFEAYKRLGESGGPIYVGSNPYNPQEMWIYYDNRGRITPFCSSSSHIPLKEVPEEQFVQQMHRLVMQKQRTTAVKQ